MYSITFAWPSYTAGDVVWLQRTFEIDSFIVDVQQRTQEITFSGNRCSEIFLGADVSITFFNKKYATMFALKYPDTYIIEESYDNS